MKNFFILDANSLIHRTFHALPPLTNFKNEPVNALYGLSNILLKFLKEEKIDYLAACFDRPEPTFRKEMLEAYKAQRPKAPQELVFQIIKAHELFEKFQIKIFEKPGFEADDLIGCLVETFKNVKDLKIYIFTGDLDTLQLVEDDKVIVKTFKKGVSEMMLYDEAQILKRFELKPKQLIDYKALIGDQSDNILGIKGIGPKTAIKILKEYGSLENLFSKKNLVLDNNLKKIFENKEQIELNLKLVKIKTDLDLKVNLQDLVYQKPANKILISYFQELGFNSLVKRLNEEEKENIKENNENLFNFQKTDLENLFVLPIEEVEKNKELFDEKIIKVGYDFHFLFKNKDFFPNFPIFDLKIAAWLLDPDQKDLSLAYLLKKYLNTFEIKKENIINLYKSLERDINFYDLNYVLQEIELPLIQVLIYLEKQGILIDKKYLLEFKKDLEDNLDILTKEIYSLTGEVFNLNSPKQLSFILFEKLKLKPVKKRRMKTGILKTEEEVLELIKDQHPVVELILKYRNIFKILTTYLKPILQLKKESRLKTNFLQTNTATGRLTSSKPNLQNIPQNIEIAEKFKKIFIAEKGYHLVSFDYSQLELRILAYETEDEKLIEAFLNDLDIHQLTASKIFKVDLNKVTPEMRRIGKTLNFGVIYGMGSNAFSTQSKISKQEAEQFIKNYFENFKKIKIWQEKKIKEAQETLLVRNRNKRLRWVKDILSEDQNLKKENERIVINMPLQSLGADIIKLAMLKVYNYLKENNLFNDVRMLLSIHDELLFEVKDDKIEIIISEIKRIMENVFDLSPIPLKVEVKIGKTWAEI